MSRVGIQLSPYMCHQRLHAMYNLYTFYHIVQHPILIHYHEKGNIN